MIFLAFSFVAVVTALIFTWWLLNPPNEIYDSRVLKATRQAIKEVCTGRQQEMIAKRVVDILGEWREGQ